MKHMKIFLSFALVAFLLVVATPVTQTTRAKRKPIQEQVTNVKVETGAEVAAKVQELKRTDRDVATALWMFERNGARPKVEDAVRISAKVNAAPNGEARKRLVKAPSLMRRASFSQQETVREGDVEITLITSLATETEWQGTIIFRHLTTGQQWVSNVVMVPPHTVVYELVIEGGTPYLVHEPGMYTGFVLGMLIADHQTYALPRGLPPSDMLPYQLWREPPPGPTEIPCPPLMICHVILVSEAEKKPTFQKAAYKPAEKSQSADALFTPARYREATDTAHKLSAPQIRSDRAIERHQVRCVGGCGPPITVLFTPPVRAWAVRTGGTCVGGGVRCALAGPGFGPCFASTCAGAAVGFAIIGVFGY